MAHQIFNLPPQQPLSAAGRVLPGSKLYFYVTQTSTPAAVYTTSALNVAHTQPLIADAGGRFDTVYLDPTIEYKATVTDANDVLLYTIDPVNDQVLSQDIIGEYLYPRTDAEITAGVTPVNYAYPPGYGERFGLTADSSTDNTTALNNLIAGSAGYVPIRIKRNGTGYYRLTGRVVAPANTHIILEDGPELRWTATAATGTSFLGSASRPGIEVTGSNFIIEGLGIIRGPYTSSFVSNEIGIFSKGTSASSRYENFSVGYGVEFRNWGYGGVVLQYWSHITLEGFYSHTHGHVGGMFLSCNHGRALGVLVGNITVGDGSGQGYGFSLTHDSTGYSSDPNISTPRTVSNPFCQDWEVSGTAYDVPIWQGFDSHGGYEIRFHDMQTYNCRYGIQIANSSGDAAAYAGANNSIHNVFCTTKKRDGSATSISSMDGTGIVINGGTTVKQTNVNLSNFVIEGYGNTTVTGINVQALRCTGTITSGRIETWKGYGIYTYNADLKIANVNCGAVADATNSVCFYEDFNGSGANIDWINCTHHALGGTVAAEGMRKADGNNRAVVQVDVSEATTPYAGSNFVAGYLTKGVSCITPTLEVTGTPTEVNLSTAGLHRTPRVRILLNPSGNSTIADIAGTFVGQEIDFHQTSANTTTFDRTNAALAGGANASIGPSDTLGLLVVATAGTKFVERYRAANS